MTTLAEAMRPLLHAGPGDHVLGFASFSFDASVWEVVMALPTGATLVVAEAQDRTPPERLTSLMRRSAVSLSFMTPSVLEVLPPDELPDLATVLVGGERVEAALTERWRERLRLLNVYGPTETTIATTAGEVESDGTPPIGTPYVNERVHVLDQWLNPVPVGVAGELFIGGAGVTRGYGGRGPSPRNASSPTRSPRTARACTARETGRADWATDDWSSSAAPTTRSRSAGSVSSPARSRRSSPITPACGPPSSRRTEPVPSASSSPTWSPPTWPRACRPSRSCARSWESTCPSSWFRRSSPRWPGCR